MKNKKVWYAVAIFLIGVGLVGGAFSLNGAFPSYYYQANTNVDLPDQASDKAGEAVNKDTKKVVIKPKSAQADKEIRAMADVQIHHEFDDKFSAYVPESIIGELEELASVDDVMVLNLHVKPVCGDGVLHPSEQCEPGVVDCPAGQECVNCKCNSPEEPPTEERTYFPDPNRTLEYNVTQVGGGVDGYGQGINVAILDTGVFKEHLDLTSNIKQCRDFTQNPKKGIPNTCYDGVYHGTHVSGIVGADTGFDGQGVTGVSPDVNIWMLKVCATSSCDDDDIARAMLYAAENGANIISMSFGGPDPSPLMKEAIDKIVYENEDDVLFVASAGNDGYGGVDEEGNVIPTIEYPAAYPEVVAAAAHDSTYKIANFSSRGVDDGDDSTIVEGEIEFSAGGVNIYNTLYYVPANPNNPIHYYGTLSGTSMAAPTIASLAAYLWQGDANSTRMYLRSLAQNPANDITLDSYGTAGPGYDIASGYGIPAPLAP